MPKSNHQVTGICSATKHTHEFTPPKIPSELVLGLPAPFPETPHFQLSQEHLHLTVLYGTYRIICNPLAQYQILIFARDIIGRSDSPHKTHVTESPATHGDPSTTAVVPRHHLCLNPHQCFITETKVTNTLSFHLETLVFLELRKEEIGRLSG